MIKLENFTKSGTGYAANGTDRSMSTPARISYQFGSYALDPAAGILTRNGQRVRLQDQPTRLLTLLLEHAGSVVDRDLIQHVLWPENTYVDFDKSVGVAMQKVRSALRDEASNPRFVETVRGRGYRFVAPVTTLSGEPFQAADAPTPAAIPEISLPVGATVEGRRPARHWRAIFATGLIVLAALAYYALRLRPAAQTTKAADAESGRVHSRRSIAIFGFRNLAGQAVDDWMSPALSEMLSTELSAGNQLRLVSGEDVIRTKRDLSLQQESSLGMQTLARFRQMSGADYVVVGAFTLIPHATARRIRLEVRLQDTRSGDTIIENSFERTDDELFELAYQAGAQLRQELGLPQRLAVAQNVPDLPANPAAIRWYVEGRGKLWGFDFMAAHDLLVKAVKADPGYPMAHAALSQAWSHLGYEANARREAKRALDESQRLPREEALVIEGRYWMAMNNLAQAESVYRELFRIFPDQLDYGLQLAEVQLRNKPSRALDTLATLRTLPAPLRDDPRIDMLESSSLLTQNGVKAHAAILRAIQKANLQGSKLIRARAYGILCQQDQANAPAAQALSECQTAREGYVQAGDLNNAARTVNDMAGVYYQQGNVLKAEEMWRDASSQFQKTGDRQALAAALNNIGDAELIRGRLSPALTLLEQAISQYTQIGDQDGMALASTDLALLLREKGDTAGAKTLYQKATAVAVQAEDKPAQAFGLMGSGDISLDEHQYGAADALYQRALEIRTEFGDVIGAAQCRVALARLLLETGDAAGAERAARAAQASFSPEQRGNEDGLSAEIVLTESLTRQGKLDEATKGLQRVRDLAAKSQNRYSKMEAELTGARLSVRQGNKERAKSVLLPLQAEARKLGFGALGKEIEAALP